MLGGMQTNFITYDMKKDYAMDIFHTTRRPFGKALYLFFLLPLIAIPAASAKEPAPLTIEGAVTVTAEQLIEMAGSMPDLVVIDARKQSDWERGHIDGTIHIVNTEMTEQTLADVARRDQPVVFYCNGPKCYRSGDASKKAVRWGWKKIFWFRGGTEEWSEMGFPLTK